MRRISVAVLAAAFCAPELAVAHTGPEHVHSFTSGFLHPFNGLDHLLAMFAVGLLAAQLGGRALWLVPGAFVITMIAGSLAGFAGIPVPGVEYAVTISIVAIALPVAFAMGMPAGLAMLYVAVFAFFHGYAHGAELPAGANAAQYILGFAAATAIIHGLGIGAGILAARISSASQRVGVRLAGGAVAIAGLALLVI